MKKSTLETVWEHHSHPSYYSGRRRLINAICFVTNGGLSGTPLARADDRDS
jgi:predicted glutamine amidotransferase